MQDRQDLRGYLTLRLSDRDGRVVEERTCKNRIVKSGRLMVAQLFAGVDGGVAPTKVTHMAVGAGAAAPTDDDTALGGQRGARKPISQRTYSEFTETAGGDAVKRVRVTLQVVFDFNEANDRTVPLREAAVFTADTGGTMYNRVVFEPVTKTDTFKLTLLWDIIF